MLSFDTEENTLQLLADDPALRRFKSHKKSVWRLKRIGDVLTIVVVAGMLGVFDTLRM